MKSTLRVLLALVVVNLAALPYWRWGIYVHVLLLVMLTIVGLLSHAPLKPRSASREVGVNGLLIDWVAHRWPFIAIALLVAAYVLLIERKIQIGALALFVSVSALFGAHVAMRRRLIWTNYGAFSADRHRMRFWFFVAFLWLVYVCFLIFPLFDQGG